VFIDCYMMTKNFHTLARKAGGDQIGKIATGPSADAVRRVRAALTSGHVGRRGRISCVFDERTVDGPSAHNRKRPARRGANKIGKTRRCDKRPASLKGSSGKLLSAGWGLSESA
jgi:hypothetical protein